MDAFREVVDRAKLKSLSLSRLSEHNSLASSVLPVSQASQAKEGKGDAKSQAVGIDLTMDGDDNAQAARTKQTQQARPAASRIWVLSDFPHVNSPDSCEQLRELLTLLTQTIQSPLAVLVTEPGMPKAFRVLDVIDCA
jgi:hypothetical protein